MILVTNARIPSITKSVRIRTIITKTTILLENYGIFRATDSKYSESYTSWAVWSLWTIN